jgi:histidinol-phosphate/aromatic aminotransferase/cobyric acid decarboxylase-like protein
MYNKSDIYLKIKYLKNQNGTHSPSINSIIENIPEIKCKIDACFLSNPYATDLFMNYIQKDLISDQNTFKKYLEYYPQQNSFIATKISKYLNLPNQNILIANGAIEIIEKIMNKMTGKVFMTLPVFSSYYEFVNDHTELVTYNGILKVEEIVKKVIDNKCNNLIIVNPNNPIGNFIEKNDLIYLLNELKHLDFILIDESFIHFATREDPNSCSLSQYVESFPNLIVVKSMSKDFGIAGIRCGYAITNSKLVSSFTKKSFLWNSNGLAEYFIGLLNNTNFVIEYENCRIRYLNEFEQFYNNLVKINDIKVFPSKTNFFLIDLKDKKAFDFACWMLVEKHIYVRTMDDKVGYGIDSDSYVRIAGKTNKENDFICDSIKEYFNKNIDNY